MSRSHKAVALAVALILTAAVSLRLSHFTARDRTPDEVYYTAYAITMVQDGYGVIHKLIREHNTHPELWVYPPPTRVGYLFVLASVMKVTHQTDIEVGRYLSCAFSILALCVLAALGLRFLNARATLTALLFMAVSPMDLAIARRAWQDGLIALVSSILMYIALEIILKKRWRPWLFLFPVVGFYCMSAKETGVAVYGLASLLLIVFLLFQKRRREAAAVVAGGIVALAAFLALMSYLCGSLPAVFQTAQHVNNAIGSNQYAMLFQKGNWAGLMQGLWLCSPVAISAAVLGVIALSFPGDKTEEQACLFFLLYFLIFSIAISIPKYFINLRYISAVYAPFYLVGGYGLSRFYVWTTQRFHNFRWVGAAGFIILLLIAAAGDYKNFHHLFIENSIRDLVNPWLCENSIYRSFL